MQRFLHRHEIDHLMQWAAQPQRKPLVVRGARQVGKSTLVREFARRAQMPLLEIDFERNPEQREAFAAKDPARILDTLALLTGRTLAAGTGSLKSLHQFLGEKRSDLALRLNALPPSLLQDSKELPDGAAISYRLLSLPLYLAGQARWLAAELLAT